MDGQDGWTLVDRRYEQADRYPDIGAVNAVDTALTELRERQETVRYWHVTGRVDADDSAVVAALDLFAALDLIDTRRPADPRTTTCYDAGTYSADMGAFRELYGYAETPYLLPALE